LIEGKNERQSPILSATLTHNTATASSDIPRTINLLLFSSYHDLDTCPTIPTQPVLLVVHTLLLSAQLVSSTYIRLKVYPRMEVLCSFICSFRDLCIDSQAWPFSFVIHLVMEVPSLCWTNVCILAHAFCVSSTRVHDKPTF
jgi:hypothetical protein